MTSKFIELASKLFLTVIRKHSLTLKVKKKRKKTIYNFPSSPLQKYFLTLLLV